MDQRLSNAIKIIFSRLCFL